MEPNARKAGRLLRIAAVVAGATAFVLLAGMVYRYERDPRSAGESAWFVGPSAAAFEQAAEAEMQAGADRLNDRSVPPSERVREHRLRLENAERLLVRSLRARPSQASALASLAAVRWELDPPATEEGVRRYLEMIELASAAAPTAPTVQRRLGELLLRMGRWDDGMTYLARAASLNPSTVTEIVAALRQAGLDAAAIAEALPVSPELLLALELPFAEDKQEAIYVAACEEMLGNEREFPTRLLVAYSNASLRLGRFAALSDGLDRIGPFGDVEVEAQRLKQSSRALMALEHREKAAAVARDARRLIPESSDLASHLGGILSRSGDPVGALQAYGEALVLLAQRSAKPAARARVYSRIGQVEEQRGNVSEAYDAYRRAVRLDPDERHASRRLKQMESAAGVR